MSEAFRAFFTKAGSPVVLDVGDKLSVTVTFSLNGFGANGKATYHKAGKPMEIVDALAAA